MNIAKALTPPGFEHLLADKNSLISRLLAKLSIDRETPHRCLKFDGCMSQSGWRGVFYPNIWEGGESRRVWRVNRLVLILSTAAAHDVPIDPGEEFITWLSRARRFYAGLESSHDTCDRSVCCHPLHVKWKTHRENVQEQAERRKSQKASSPRRSSARTRSAGSANTSGLSGTS